MLSGESAELRLMPSLLARWQRYRQWLQERHALMEIVQRKDDHLLRDAGLSDTDIAEGLKVLSALKDLVLAEDCPAKRYDPRTCHTVGCSTPSATLIRLHTGNIAKTAGRSA